MWVSNYVDLSEINRVEETENVNIYIEVLFHFIFHLLKYCIHNKKNPIIFSWSITVKISDVLKSSSRSFSVYKHNRTFQFLEHVLMFENHSKG